MPRQTKALVQEAEKLGIDVDRRWSDETLQEHIDVAKANAGQEASNDDPDAKAKAAVASLNSEAGATGAGGNASADADAGGEEGTVAGAGELAGKPEGGDAEGSVPADGSDVGQSPPQAVDAGIQEGEGAASVLSPTPSQPDGADGKHSGPDDHGSSGPLGLGGRDDQSPSQDTSAPPEGTEGTGNAEADDARGHEGGAAGDSEGGEQGPDHEGTEGVAAVDPASVEAGELIEADADAERQNEQRDASFADARKLAVGPINAAMSAACMVAGALGEDDGEIRFDAHWLSPAQPHPGDWLPQVIRHAVPFIRTYPDAPPEALFITMKDAAPELGHEGNWTDLPAAHRFAWEVFRDTLIKVDGLVAEEDARAAPASTAERPRYPADDDEKTLQLDDDTFALSDVGKAVERRAGEQEALS